MLEVFSSSTFIGLDFSPNEFTDNSFLSNEFFLALEKSKSIGKGTGWITFPIIVKEGATVVGCMPIFLNLY